MVLRMEGEKMIIDSNLISKATEFTVYLLEDGIKYFVWGTDVDPNESWEMTLEHPCVLRFKLPKGEGYIYIEPAPGAVVVYENGISRKEFVFDEGGRLIPRTRGIE